MNVVSGAGYDLTAGEGLGIWEECLARATERSGGGADCHRWRQRHRDARRRGRTTIRGSKLVRPRLGQGTFRVSVTAAYGGACAVSGEHSLPVLEGCPDSARYSTEGRSYEVSNGLLLRADIHRLFRPRVRHSDARPPIRHERAFAKESRTGRRTTSGTARCLAFRRTQPTGLTSSCLGGTTKMSSRRMRPKTLPTAVASTLSWPGHRRIGEYGTSPSEIRERAIETKPEAIGGAKSMLWQ